MGCQFRWASHPRPARALQLTLCVPPALPSYKNSGSCSDKIFPHVAHFARKTHWFEPCRDIVWEPRRRPVFSQSRRIWFMTSFWLSDGFTNRHGGANFSTGFSDEGPVVPVDPVDGSGRGSCLDSLLSSSSM